MTTYKVTGVQAFRGVQPGGTFEADPDDPQIVSNLGDGVITAEAAPKVPEKAATTRHKEKE